MRQYRETSKGQILASTCRSSEAHRNGRLTLLLTRRPGNRGVAQPCATGVVWQR